MQTPDDLKKPALLLITGWAHGTAAMQPLADAMASSFRVRILTGAQVLSDRSIPPSDYIVTGSMGGLLTLELLPENCRKLVLISSTAKFCSAAGYACGTPERILRRMMLQLQRRPDAVLEEFFRNVHYPHACGSGAYGRECASAWKALAAGLQYLRESDVRDRLPSIKIPVLLLHGAEDRIIPPAAAEWLHRGLPDSRLRIFEDHGHALLAHHFDVTADAIRSFLLHSGTPKET